MIFEIYDAPCGRLRLGVRDGNVFLCDWITGERIENTLRRIKRFLPPESGTDNQALIEEAVRQLDEYFSGVRREFDVPLQSFGTEFQHRVWEALGGVPFGKTVSYKAVAEAVGNPRGVRAVASAVGANPLSILIPCHRVIGVGGSLAGYAGGLEAKKYLLGLEKTSQPL